MPLAGQRVPLRAGCLNQTQPTGGRPGPAGDHVASAVSAPRRALDQAGALGQVQGTWLRLWPSVCPGQAEGVPLGQDHSRAVPRVPHRPVVTDAHEGDPESPWWPRGAGVALGGDKGTYQVGRGTCKGSRRVRAEAPRGRPRLVGRASPWAAFRRRPCARRGPRPPRLPGTVAARSELCTRATWSSGG